MTRHIKTLAEMTGAALSYDAYQWQDLTFDRAVLVLARRGMLRNVYEIVPNVWAGDPETIGWAGVAFELAHYLRGQIRLTRGNNGVSWINGRGGPHGMLVPTGLVQTLHDCREMLSVIGINDGPLDGFWSVGAMARRLLTWVDKAQPYEKQVECVLDGFPYGYHDCKPGVYEGAPEYIRNTLPSHDLFNLQPADMPNPEYRPELTMYDATAYYWNLIQRLRSLRITPYPNGAVSQWPMPPEASARWKRLKKDINDASDQGDKRKRRSFKTLRNSMCGVMAGSLQPGIAYCRDYLNGRVIRIQPQGRRGPFAGAGLLVVRIGGELCREESLTTESVYSTIDCVVSRSREPSVWKSHGLPYGVKASGSGVIVARGVWRIGVEQTLRYGKGEEERPIPLLPQPPVLYYRSIL